MAFFSAVKKIIGFGFVAAFAAALVVLELLAVTAPCSAENPADNRVVIYSGAEEYRNEYFLKRLNYCLQCYLAYCHLNIQ